MNEYVILTSCVVVLMVADLIMKYLQYKVWKRIAENEKEKSHD